MSVVVEAVSKRFIAGGRASQRREILALDTVDVEARPGEILAIVGPSGSGKTTLLRCIAGLERPDSGSIRVAGRDVSGVAPRDRDAAMVFQEHALYPHMTVERNISFGLRARKVAAAEITERVERVASQLGLAQALGRRPAQLSGGERQRVALARAIVREPRAFLLDEPLSNLDAELRTRTRAELRSLQRRLATTMVYVTHDQVEAMTLGDRVAVLRAGRVEQVGAPMEVYDSPANAFVARFLGSPPMNLFPARLISAAGGDGVDVLGLRPEALSIVDPQEARLTGTVVLVERIGNESLVHVDVRGHTVRVRVDRSTRVAERGSVGLAFSDESLYRFDASARRLP